MGSRPQGLMIHKGNVSYCDTKIALLADELKIQRQQDNSSILTAQGKPVFISQQSDVFSFDAESRTTEYRPNAKSLNFVDNVTLNLKTPEQKIIIKTDRLAYTFKDKDTLEPEALNAAGSPIQLTLSGQDSKGLEATAQHLKYSYDSGIFTLSGNVEFKQAGDIILAEKLIYNTVNKSWEVPAIQDKRIEIIKNPNL